MPWHLTVASRTTLTTNMWVAGAPTHSSSMASSMACHTERCECKMEGKNVQIVHTSAGVYCAAPSSSVPRSHKRTGHPASCCHCQLRCSVQRQPHKSTNTRYKLRPIRATPQKQHVIPAKMTPHTGTRHESHNARATAHPAATPRQLLQPPNLLQVQLLPWCRHNPLHAVPTP